MRNFTIFSANFLKYIKARNLNLEEIVFHKNRNVDFEKNILNGLFNCHIFEVSEDIKKLLTMTNTPKKNSLLKLPFPVIFIDLCFKKKDFEKIGIDIGFDEINGIIVQEGRVIENKTKKEIGKNLRISICAIVYGKHWVFETYSEEMDLFEEYKPIFTNINFVQEKDLNKVARRFMHTFVLNFLNFINSPEVSYVTVESDKDRNAKRIQNNKLPIPNRNMIRLNGALKVYLDDIKKNPVWHYNYRFWVRGHFRTLRNIRYGDNVGKRIWIPPFVKGKGVLIEKNYKVDK